MIVFGRILSRYIFWQAAGALILILVSLTTVVWIAVALRQLELMTSQGQDALRFLIMTALAIPSLLALIAPIALLIACLHVLNKLGGDSELIVMTAGGAPVWSLLKPFCLLAVLVAIGVSMVNHVVGPWSQKLLREYTVLVRTDLIGQVIQPWRFTEPEAKADGAHSRSRLGRKSARVAAARCSRPEAGGDLSGRTGADHQAGRRRLLAHGKGTHPAARTTPKPHLRSSPSPNTSWISTSSSSAPIKRNRPARANAILPTSSGRTRTTPCTSPAPAG